MKTIILQILVAFSHQSSPAPVTESHAAFGLLGLHIGQSVEDAKKKYPSMQCANSCNVEGQKAFGKPGRLWAGIGEGKIDQLAFGFKPNLSPEETGTVRSFYVDRYGAPSSSLGEKGCDEWEANGGYLVLCMTGHVSHIWWSTKSRVDVNDRR